MTDVLSVTEREVVRRVTGSDVVDESLVQERHHIVRVALADARTVVVKRLRADGEKRRDGDAGFDREWAALSHLNGCDVVPSFLGGDKSAPLLVMSELPPGRSLADSLLGDDREQAVVDLAAYASTLARVNSFAAFSADRPARLAGIRHGGAVFAAEDVLSEVVEALDEGPQGVLHGDPCPDNVVIDADGVCRIFDFEFATGGPVALDAAYLLAPFPSCWCFAPLPADAVEAALDAYRAVLPIDERALSAATVVTAVSSLAILDAARAGDSSWGLTTLRPQLLAWLEAASLQSSFPRAAERATQLADELRGLWGDVTAPPYPAFATRG